MKGEDQAMSRVESIAAAAVHQINRADHGVTMGQAFRVWLRVAALSFGGPAGQIAVTHRIIRRGEEMDLRQPISARAQLLHVAARPRSNSRSILVG
jgi:hypothetical protein